MLDQALESVRNAEWRETLALLIAYWDEHPSPSPLAADLIQRVAELASSGLTPLDKLGDAEVNEVFEQQRPEDLDRVLAFLTSSTIKSARSRTERIADWPPDPRIDRHFARLLEELPFQSLGSKRFWTHVFNRLRELKDVSVLPTLARLDARFKQFVAVTMATWLRDRTTDLISALRDRGRAVDGYDRADEESLQAIFNALPERRKRQPTSGDRLLADVLENPADDEPRLVYADWLLEHDDPHGEFIMLQFDKQRAGYSRKHIKRENELLAKHWKEWVGPLANALIQRGRGFERGFLVECIAQQNPLRVHESLGSPYWSTVKHFIGPSAVYQQRELMKSLESLTLPWEDPLEEFCKTDRPWPLKRLVCEARNSRDVEALVNTDCLPDLADLFLRNTSRKRSQAVLQSPLADQLSTVAVSLARAGSGNAGSWLRWLYDNSPQFTCFRLDATDTHYNDFAGAIIFFPGPEGRYTDVVVDVGSNDFRFADAIDSLPIKLVRRIEVVKSRHRSRNYTRIIEATKRFHGRAEVVVPQ